MVHKVVNRVESRLRSSQETVLRRSVIEICGFGRVLIENHSGVTEYSRELIRVGLPSGSAIITGEEMTLQNMSVEALVITGRITDVHLEGRPSPSKACSEPR